MEPSQASTPPMAGCDAELRRGYLATCGTNGKKWVCGCGDTRKRVAA